MIYMQKAKKGVLAALLVGVGVLGLAGCGDTPTATPIAPTATTASSTGDVAATATTGVMEEPTATTDTSMTEEPTATTGTSGTGGGEAMDLLTRSADAMKNLKSYHMSMQLESAGTTTSIEGDVELPDKYRLNIDAGGGVSTETIIVGGSSYTKMPGTDQYVASPFNSSLLDAANTSDIADVAQNATVVGDETLDGVDTTHVKYSANDPTGTSGATGDVDAWIEKSTGYIHQYKVSSSAAGVSSTTTVMYSKFNETIDPPIEKPDNVMDPGNLVPTVSVP